MERFANVNEHDAKVLMEIEKIVGGNLKEVDWDKIYPNGDFSLRYISRGVYYSTNNNAVTSIFFLDIDLDTPKIYNVLCNFKSLQNIIMQECRGISSFDISLSGIEVLKQLTHLVLINNQILDISPIEGLINLEHLHWVAVRAAITNMSPIAKLFQLNTLHIKGNHLNDISFLSNLSNLRELDLSNNEIIEITPIKNLIFLEKLNLAGNRIDDISVIGNLAKLQELNLESNYISNINSLNYLPNLITINLSGNKISNLGSLSKLSNLQQLNLGSNKISDISPLSSLFNLKFLLSYDNSIFNISPLSNLYNLDELYLGSNQITDISPLSSLSNLQLLGLEGNQITDISPLSSLSNLQTLDLAENQISDILPLSNLLNLKYLYLNNNQIQTIPEQLYKQTNKVFLFRDNPIISPPLAVLKQGYEVVMNYYKQLEAQGKIYLNECKLLILGDAGVGKTSLNKKIIDKNATLPAQEEYTKGTNVTTYQFSHTYDGQELNYKAHIWDFGGQTVYHNLHRYFMTDRSLYILVLDSNNKGTHFTEWLWTQKTYGIDSPLLVVNNHKRGNEHTFNLARYASDFPSLRLPILDINLEHIEASQHQLLVDKLQAEIRNLPVIMEGVPSYWGDVRAALENLKQSKKYIRREEFDEICAEHHITEEADISTMLSYFHNIGILLCYQQNDNISDIVVLDMQWVLDNTYSILNDNDIAEKQAGKFTRADFKRLIPSKDIRLIISNLMVEFHIIYTNEQDDYIAPALLPDTDTCETEFNNYHLDREIYQQLIYEFSMPIPIGLFHQLIVKLHHYIYNGLVSRYEVVLDKNNTRVLIVESPIKHTISIQLKSSAIENLKGFQAIIMEHIDSLTERYRTKKDTLFIRKTPCICAECTKSTTPHFYDYDKEIARYNEHHISTIRCVQSLKEVSIEELYGYLISKPVVYCMFGDSTHLNVDQESKKIRKHIEDIPAIDFKHEYNVNTDTLIHKLELYRNRLSIFHFGGHANQNKLLLNNSTSSYAKGLPELFKNMPRLKAIILNGCATADHVKYFLSAGVPIVIATSGNVADETAILFSDKFYEALSKQKSIGEAYNEAIRTIRVNNQELANRNINSFRKAIGIPALQKNDLTDNDVKWKLFYNPQKENYLDFKLF